MTETNHFAAQFVALTEPAGGLIQRLLINITSMILKNLTSFKGASITEFAKKYYQNKTQGFQ